MPVAGTKRKHVDVEGDGESESSDHEVPDHSDRRSTFSVLQIPSHFNFPTENWDANNSLFLEDGGICGPVGRVVKVRDPWAIIRIRAYVDLRTYV